MGGWLFVISSHVLPLYTENRKRFAPGKKPCGEPTCTIKVPVTSAHQCPCERWVHGFCGRGIGEEGHGQQIEYTDCQKITPGDKTSISSPREVDGDDEQENSG